MSQLKALNGLNSNQIRSGQVLRLKGNPISPSKAPSKVSAAKPAKASAEKPTTASAAKPTTASAAEPAKVPAAKPKAQTVNKSGVKEAAQPAQSAERPAAAQSDKVSGGTYFVRTGDSLWAISRHHGISVSEIKLNNHLKSDVIYPGQKLNFNVQNKGQTHNQANKTYAIKRGDTLWDIARAHGTTVSKLMKENHLHSSLIFAGDQLKLPKK
ncbi:LysM peptidoglycan-binding domain-containing protein [Sporolactobacillus sp. Y61]|uniref:LysM peptidoglycan-binding domain-containing protein n=1 Tax=Sporolactobacillus sp. Y61 TaxID=3160863 RepID=A0AAU8IJC7_9BACL